MRVFEARDEIVFEFVLDGGLEEGLMLVLLALRFAELALGLLVKDGGLEEEEVRVDEVFPAVFGVVFCERNGLFGEWTAVAMAES